MSLAGRAVPAIQYGECPADPYIQPYFGIAFSQWLGYVGSMKEARFEWDNRKDKDNQAKHGVSFTVAQRAFLDAKRVIAEDTGHGAEEKRFFCIGKVGGGILTVRFTVRGDVIRIFGAGYWRGGKQIYEEKNKIHR